MKVKKKGNKANRSVIEVSALLGQLVEEELTEEEQFLLNYAPPLAEDSDWELFVKAMYPDQTPDSEAAKSLSQNLSRKGFLDKLSNVVIRDVMATGQSVVLDKV